MPTTCSPCPENSCLETEKLSDPHEGWRTHKQVVGANRMLPVRDLCADHAATETTVRAHRERSNMSPADEEGTNTDMQEHVCASSPMTTRSRRRKSVAKSSLQFILDDSSSPDQKSALGAKASGHSTRQRAAEASKAPAVRIPSPKTTRRARTTTGVPPPGTVAVDLSRRSERKRKARRRPPSRICKYEGCEQYVVDQGLCVRHGGGKRCEAEGCTSRAKHKGLCWKHGGSIGCKTPGCTNRAKSRGYCWSHGGGTKCKASGCGKIAISNGLCWAHGGGKRCVVDGCKRQAYERTQNHCKQHYEELVGADVDALEGGDEEEQDEEEEDVSPMEQEKGLDIDEEEKGAMVNV